MKINTQQTLKTLDGKALKNDGHDFTLGEAIANILTQERSGGKMKMFILAEKIYKSKSIELDNADLSLIRTTVENSDYYNVLVTGQVLNLLEKE